jgi:hypothetical protein
MKIALASAVHDVASSPVIRAFCEQASQCAMMSHCLVDSPDLADCVLFVDLHLCPGNFNGVLRRHPLFLKYQHKSLVYDERDEPWCTSPGVYVSMPRGHFDHTRQRAFAYYTGNDATAADPFTEPDLLFSFVGSPGHRTSGGFRVRRELLRINHPRALIEDSSGFVFYDDHGSPDTHRRRQTHFASTLTRSKFVLCPRGRGTSSIRMYETLRGGRVPVVLADEWMPPDGPEWSAFTLTVRERDARGVAGIIEANEHRWPAMSKAARGAYDRWFSPQVAVSRIFDLCAELLESPAPRMPSWRSAGYGPMVMRSLRTRMRSVVGSSLRAVWMKSPRPN